MKGRGDPPGIGVNISPTAVETAPVTERGSGFGIRRTYNLFPNPKPRVPNPELIVAANLFAGLLELTPMI